MRIFIALAALSVSACGEKQSASGETADAVDRGWSIRPEGDLNAFFDCLASDGATIIAAHRGGPAADLPENAIETFVSALSAAPVIIEADVATSADGVLFLLHDETLDRTTTGSGAADQAQWDQIRKLQLKDRNGAVTEYHPPSFADALSWAAGRTILEIDFKRSTRYEGVIAEIYRQQAEDRVILIAYTTAQAARLHRLAPDMMISTNISSQSDLNRTIAAGVPADDLLGFTGVETPDQRLFSLLESQEIEVVFGTLGGRNSIDSDIEYSGDDNLYAEIAAMGVDIIATDRPMAAQKALDKAGRGAAPGDCGVIRR